MSCRASVGSGYRGKSSAGTSAMASRSMRSRQWSCSELEQGSQALLRVKKEKPSSGALDDELEKAPSYIS